MSYTERACAIDLSLQSLLQRHSIKETGVDIWRQRFHRKYTFTAVHTKTHRRRFQIYPLWRAFLNLCVYGERFYRLRVDGRPKRIKKFAFTLLRLQSSSCGQGLRVDVVQGNSNMALIIAGWACIYNINYLQSWAWVKMNAVILTQFSSASILASKYIFFQFLSSRILKMSDHILQIQF